MSGAKPNGKGMTSAFQSAGDCWNRLAPGSVFSSALASWHQQVRMDIKSTDATDLDLALLMRLVPSGELLVHGKDMSPLSILPDETGRVQGKGSRSFLGDPLSHLVQGSLPPLPGEQLGHLAELHDRLLGEAAMLGL